MFFFNKLLYGYMNGYIIWFVKGYKGGLRIKKKKKRRIFYKVWLLSFFGRVKGKGKYWKILENMNGLIIDE